MPKLRSRRPSASMVVAVAALFVAVSGTAIAAHTLASGDKLIAKNSLSGNRLRKATVTRKQIDVKALGKVPSAVTADLATSATRLGGDVTVTPFAHLLHPGPPSKLVTVNGSFGLKLSIFASCSASGKADLFANGTNALEVITDVSGSPPQSVFTPNGNVPLTAGSTSTPESGTANFVTNVAHGPSSLEQDYQIEWNAWPENGVPCQFAGDIISTTP